MPRSNIIAPRGNVVTPRGNATNRQASSGRQFVDGSGGVVDDMTFISETVVGGGGAASVTFSAISGAFRHLFVYYVCRGDNGSPQDLQMQINGDSGANYYRQAIQGSNTTATFVAQVGQTSMSVGRVPGTGAPAGSMGAGQIMIPYYSTTTQDKAVIAFAASQDSLADTGQFANMNTFIWSTANAAITQLVFTASAGSFIQDTRFSLYGLT